MTTRRFSPWPAYTDLFSGLLVLVFAVLVIDQVSSVPLTVRAAQKVYDSLKGYPEVSRCSPEDVCVDIVLNFDPDRDEIKPGDVDRLHRIAVVLLKVMEQQERSTPGIKKILQIVVEGHTDSTQPRGSDDSRVIFTWNWNLSARRASSVMYQLSRFGLGPERDYNVISWGLADSDPDPTCKEPTERCGAMNRRTTIRLKFDYKRAVAEHWQASVAN